MKATIAMVFLLGLGLSPVSKAASFSATPLLEVEGRGLRTTDVDIPLCGNTCDAIHPHFLSYRVAIMTGGAVVGTLTENDLENRATQAVTRAFRGNATPAQMATLRTLLTEARIGFQEGGCTAGFSEEVPDQPNPTRHDFLLSYSVLWFGKGKRVNYFELPLGAGACEAPLRNLMRHVAIIARDAARDTQRRAGS